MILKGNKMTYYHGKKLSDSYSKNPIVSHRADGSKVIEMIYKDCCQGYNRLDKLIRKPENKRLNECNGFLKVQLPNGIIISSSIYKNVDCQEERIYVIKKSN